MPVRRDTRHGGWFFRKQVRLPDGRRVRVYGVPDSFGLPNTRVGAAEAELREVNRVLNTGVAKVVAPPKKEVPTVEAFSKVFLEVAELKNKQSSVESKETIVRVHLVPRIGTLRLDQIDYAVIEDLKLALSKSPIGNAERRPGSPVKRTLSWKTINNCLTVLRRMLEVARKRGLIDRVPEVEWLRGDKPEFDFLDFEEAERLVAGAEDEWRAMLLVALRTGMRLGELLGLRWQDVDLVAGRLVVERNIVRGKIGSPKSGRSREIALGDEVLAALKGHRHLRGESVFCDVSGRPLRKGELRHPLRRACARAGLRPIGWHVLRHTFASHLAMRGAPLKAVQELLGHATIQMTMRYAHLSPDVARDAVRLLDAPRGSVVAANERRSAK